MTITHNWLTTALRATAKSRRALCPPIYGNAFFAAVYTLEHSLPSVENTRNSAIIFSMRGREMVTSTLLAFLERYARKLQAGGNRLMLAGVEPRVMKEL